MSEEEDEGIPTTAYEGEANLGGNYVQKLKSTHPLPEVPEEDIHELVRRQDVIDLIRSKVEEVEEAYDKGFAVNETSILRELKQEVQQSE